MLGYNAATPLGNCPSLWLETARATYPGGFAISCLYYTSLRTTVLVPVGRYKAKLGGDQLLGGSFCDRRLTVTCLILGAGHAEVHFRLSPTGTTIRITVSPLSTSRQSTEILALAWQQLDELLLEWQRVARGKGKSPDSHLDWTES